MSIGKQERLLAIGSKTSFLYLLLPSSLPWSPYRLIIFPKIDSTVIARSPSAEGQRSNLKDLYGLLRRLPAKARQAGRLAMTLWRC
ncbi:hypothetical protein ACFLWS_04620 [Chloroflexota bacterium]